MLQSFLVDSAAACFYQPERSKGKALPQRLFPAGAKRSWTVGGKVGFDEGVNPRHREMLRGRWDTGRLELALLGGDLDDESDKTGKQGSGDRHQREWGCCAEGHNGGPIEDGQIGFQSAVNSLGCGAEGVEFFESVGAAGDFQDQVGELDHRDMGGEAEFIGPVGTIALEFEMVGIGRSSALHETGKGEAAGLRVITIGAGKDFAVGNEGPAVAVVAASEFRLAR